jgi:hypothetical protein
VALMFAVKCYALRMFFPSSVSYSYDISYQWDEFNQKLLEDDINTWNSDICYLAETENVICDWKCPWHTISLSIHGLKFPSFGFLKCKSLVL